MSKMSVCLLLLVLSYSVALTQRSTSPRPYFYSDEIKNVSFQTNEYIPFKGYSAQLLYSYIGNYEMALQRRDAAESPLDSLYKKLDSTAIANYKTVDARSEILRQASNNKIIIINEVHLNPSHRIFTMSLLKELRKNGYSYLSIEGLIRKKGDSVNLRGYPLLADIEYKDPQYANLVRKGLELHYKVSGHDTADYSAKDDPTRFAQLRDSLGAVNIKKILDSDKNAKIVVTCGYSHGYECAVDIGKRFALQVKQLTGIDPYTINQEMFMENDLNVIHPLVYIKRPTKTIGIKLNDGCADLYVCHPATKIVQGRPDWLLVEGKKYYSPVKYLMKGKNYLVQAYKESEDVNRAFPVDVIEIRGGKDNKSLILSPGKYNLLIREQGGAEKLVAVTVK